MTPVLPDSAQQRLLRSIESFSRALRESAVALSRDLGCTRGTLAIIRILEARGSVQVGEIAHLMRVDISVASRQVSQLVDEGLVERAVDDEDRRVRTVRLSPAGRALADDVREQLDTHLEEIFGDWSPAEFTATTDALDRLAATLTTPLRHDAPGPVLTPA